MRVELIAANTAKTVCGKIPDGSTLVIYDQTSFSSIQAYEAFIANIEVLYRSYRTLIPRPNELPQNPTEDDNTYGLGLSSTIDPFSDASSLLSAIAIASNTETPGSITIPDSSMAIAERINLKNPILVRLRSWESFIHLFLGLGLRVIIRLQTFKKR